MVRSISCGFSPRPTDSEPCGSKSTSSTLRPYSASEAPRLIVVVVLPTPPFWLHIETTRAGPCSVSCRGSGIIGHRPAGRAELRLGQPAAGARTGGGRARAAHLRGWERGKGLRSSGGISPAAPVALPAWGNGSSERATCAHPTRSSHDLSTQRLVVDSRATLGPGSDSDNPNPETPRPTGKSVDELCTAPRAGCTGKGCLCTDLWRTVRPGQPAGGASSSVRVLRVLVDPAR